MIRCYWPLVFNLSGREHSLVTHQLQAGCMRKECSAPGVGSWLHQGFVLPRSRGGAKPAFSLNTAQQSAFGPSSIDPRRDKRVQIFFDSENLKNQECCDTSSDGCRQKRDERCHKKACKHAHHENSTLRIRRDGIAHSCCPFTCRFFLFAQARECRFFLVFPHSDLGSSFNLSVFEEEQRCHPERGCSSPGPEAFFDAIDIMNHLDIPPLKSL